MNDDFNHENLKGVKKFLDDLEKTSRDNYFRLCYTTLVTNPKDVLDNSADAKLKHEGLLKLITYFEDKEEYEKCFELQKLLKMI